MVQSTASICLQHGANSYTTTVHVDTVEASVINTLKDDFSLKVDELHARS